MLRVMHAILMMAKDTDTAAAPAATESGTETLRDLSIKSMKSDPKEAIRQKKRVYMGRMFGEAVTIKTAEDRKGNVFSYFIGSFSAINADGLEFESTKLFLPKGATEAVEAAMKKAGENPVEFAYDIWVEPAETTIGYQYVVKALMQTEGMSRTAAIMKKLESIPFPKK